MLLLKYIYLVAITYYRYKGCEKINFLAKYKIMGKKDQTTVNLNELAQKVKEDLAPIYRLKNILSAGLILFGRLSADRQRQHRRNGAA